MFFLLVNQTFPIYYLCKISPRLRDIITIGKLYVFVTGFDTGVWIWIIKNTKLFQIFRIERCSEPHTEAILHLLQKNFYIIGIYTVRYLASKIKTGIRKIHRMPVSVCGICRYGKSVQTLFSSANHLKYSSMRFVTSRSRSGSLSHIWISRDTGAAKDIESRAGSLFRIMPLSIIA